MNDTAADIADEMRRMMSRRSGAERMLMAASMFDSARQMIIASLPKNLTPNELRQKLCERTYGFTLDEFLAESTDENRP